MLDKKIENKLKLLKKQLLSLKSVVVAFSGGIDSTLLLKAAHDVLAENSLAVIIASAFFPQPELDSAIKTARQIGCRYKVIKLDVLKNSKISKNPKNRCYICKKLIMQALLKIAKTNKLKHVIEGSNFDDLSEHRPGKQALLELGISSPLAESKLTKPEIRQLLRYFGFKQWDHGSSSCLATRFSYGTILNNIDLEAVDCAEAMIKSYGFKQVRVRMHKRIARIEVSKNEIKELFKILDKKLIQKIKKLGFNAICIDVEGYCSGSMDSL
ncbi:MAG: ATP-dependent sacrificial sulfur transferase LarE [Candidatus Omnitrophica bacterium]|nr:ATP-dependent sacrificial sulfur transferase LarE [Candidatus Omnitrophota bacterium]